MNLQLNYEEFRDNLVWGYPKPHYEGVHYKFKFRNNYGASVFKSIGSLGHEDDLWELAVRKYENDLDEAGTLCFDTPITDTTMGYQTEEEILELLRQIRELW